MVLTSFNQKAYEEDLKNQYKEGVEEGFSLGRMQMAQEIALRLFHSGNSPEQIAQLTGIDAVSYTHLDVYKRQAAIDS